jgi:hypothetical protein
MYELANTGRVDAVVNANDLQVGVYGYPQPLVSEEVDFVFGSGYTRRQLSFGGTLLQRWNFLSPMEPGESTHFYTGPVRLRPGESAPFVLHSVALAPGEYELAAAGAYYPNRDERVPLLVGEPLDIPLPNQGVKTNMTLRCEASVQLDDEWFVFKGRLLPCGSDTAFIFARPEHGMSLLPGLVQLRSPSSAVLAARLDWHEPDPPWVLTQVGVNGLPFTFRVRQADRFSREPIATMTLWTVTSNGIEKLLLADSLPVPGLPPLPPWGETRDGCRLRLALPREVFSSNERIRFFFQAESDGTQADMVWMDKGHFPTHVVASVDGSSLPIGETGISDEHVNLFPFQGEIKLASLHKVQPGRHTLQLSIRGDPGTYTNLRGEKFRKFNGKIVSNMVQFEVSGEEHRRTTP